MIAPDLRGAAILHAVVGAIALLIYGLTSPPTLGWGLLGLLIGYQCALPIWAHRAGHQWWLNAWRFLLPVSLLQLLADASLVNGPGTLIFPDLGAPRVLGVSVYMAFMWTIPLIWIARAPTVGLAALATLAIFVGAEALAEPLGLWQAQNAPATAGVAHYVLLPELLLGLLCWSAIRRLKVSGTALRLAAAGGISATYTGTLLWSWTLTS